MLKSNYDPRPIKVRVIARMLLEPDRVWTIAELSRELNIWRPTLSADVSKLHSYGGPIEKIGNMRWKLKIGGPLDIFRSRNPSVENEQQEEEPNGTVI